ncbi:hypothetical protein Tco_1283903 [Tanacetum coccineum]
MWNARRGTLCGCKNNEAGILLAVYASGYQRGRGQMRFVPLSGTKVAKDEANIYHVAVAILSARARHPRAPLGGSGKTEIHYRGHRLLYQMDGSKSLSQNLNEAVIPTEIGMPTYRTIQWNEAQNEEEMRLNLDLIQERRETTAIWEAKYKKKVEQYYNKRVCPVSFKVEDFVYRRNEASRVENQGKLGPNWEGPYHVVEAYENGSYKLGCDFDAVSSVTAAVGQPVSTAGGESSRCLASYDFDPSISKSRVPAKNSAI